MVDFYRFEHFGKFDGLLHAVTKKLPNMPLSFSLALHTGEERTQVIQNRKRVAQLLDPDREFQFVLASQTHSNNVRIITTQEERGWSSLEDTVEECDAMITNLQNIILTIVTADCVPLLMYDKKQKVVAVVHAGWKGTKANIAAKTIDRMNDVFGCEPKDILAGIAPSIGKCCYEVDENIAKYFSDIPNGYDTKDDRYMLDLPYINKKQLLDAGLQEENIEMSNICTACDSQSFFSYRKEQGCTGRFMSLIGISPVGEMNE